MSEESSPRLAEGTNSAIIELAIEMAGLCSARAESEEERVRSTRSILRKAAELKRSIEE